MIQQHIHTKKEDNGVDTLYAITHLSIKCTTLLDLADDTTSSYFLCVVGLSGRKEGSFWIFFLIQFQSKKKALSCYHFLIYLEKEIDW